jgi:hypothetical protein
MLQTGDILMIVFGAAPISLLLIGGLVVAIGLAVKYFLENGKPIEPVLYWYLVAGIAIPFLIGGLLCVICYRVRPTEAFQMQDISGDPNLLADLIVAEDAVCKLITRVDGFIQNDVGPAGQSDSQLVLAAQMKARDGVAVVDCSATEAALEDAPHRLTRLEETLRSLTGPELQRTYDKTMRCEGFQDLATPEPTNRQRLTAIQATIRDQQTRLLAPVDQKTADLQRGIASDCDKRRAAAAAQTLPGGGSAGSKS